MATLLGAEQQGVPLFRTRTTFVQLDVVVTDHENRPVTDLTAADFEVRERGHLQTITDFDVVIVPPAQRIIDLDATPAPRPDVASSAPPARTARAFAFVLDDTSLEPRYLFWIKTWMSQFLGALYPEDRVAIVYVSRSDLSQDFTHDTGTLVQAVNNLRGAPGLPVGNR